ncbi:MAG: leucine-rich repeat protein [Acutalibacteraceae bacterium]
MKKIKYLLAIVSVLVMLLTFCIAASAANEQYNSGVFTYTVTDGEATITRCDSSVEGHLVIPESIDGYKVTAFAEKAFYSCEKIVSVTIPQTVKRIGARAFSYNIENVYVDSMDFWYDIVFESSSANPLDQAESFYIGGELMTELIIPEGVTELHDYAFYGCESLISVTFPKSLKVLGEWNFAFCDNLQGVYADSVRYWIDLYEGTYKAGKEVYLCSPIRKNTKLYLGGELVVDLVIPEGVTMLTPDVFSHLKTLESVTFPKGFTRMIGNAFSASYNIKEIYVPDLKVWFSICSEINREIKGIETLYINNEPVIDLIIPEDIDTIVEDAFYRYKKLRSITFTSPIKQFGNFWAYGCENFEAIYVDSFETWNGCEFGSNSHNPLNMVDYLYIDGEPVVDLVIPQGTTSISDNAFQGYRALKSVSIPKSVQHIGNYAFFTNFESVYVESVEAWINTCLAMGDKNAYVWHPMQHAENFYVGGELLTDLVIPEGVTEISKTTFYYVDTIKSVTFPSSISKINYSIIYNSDAIDVYVPDVKTWLNVSYLLKSNKINTIFLNGEELEDLVITEDITELPMYSFYKYKKLKSVTLSASLISIGSESFTECDAIERVYVDSIETLMNIEFKGLSANPMSLGADLYIDNTLVTELIIPDGVTDIGNYTFAGCCSVKTLVLPTTVTKIGSGSFADEALEKVYAPSLEMWLEIDFKDKTSNPMAYAEELYINNELFEELRMPEGVSVVKPYAFYGCDTLRKIIITEETISLCDYAFAECSDFGVYVDSVSDWLNVKFGNNILRRECNPLYFGADLYIKGELATEIVIPSSSRNIPCWAFIRCKSLKKITIPATTSIGAEAFASSGLKEAVIGSLTEKAEPKAVIGFYDFAFAGELEKITFGYGVRKIGDNSFKGSKKLKEVVFYPGILSIGKEAFSESGVTSVYIPSSVTVVEEYAFSSCPDLESVTLGEERTERVLYTDLEKFVFSRCDKLETVIFNSGVSKVYEYAFYKSDNIKNVYINDLAAYLNIIFPTEMSQTKNVNPVMGAENLYVEGKIAENIVIPEGIVSICNYAFNNCKTLKSVTFPSTLRQIGDGAFAGCVNLGNVVFPDSLEEIGDSGFEGCFGITELKFGKNLDRLGFFTFGGCKNLKVIYLYSEELVICEAAFDFNQNIEIVFYTGSKEAWDKLLAKNKKTGLEGVAVYYRFRPESMYAPASVTSTQTVDSITVAWSPVTGVTGYRLFMKQDNSWKTMKTVKDTTVKVTGLKSGTKYTFAVKAYISSGAFVLWSPEYITIDTATKAVKPSKVISTQSSSTIKLSWTSCPGATGYRIYFKSGNNWKVAVSTTTATSHTFKNLKAGEKYTFAVRPYIKNGSTVIWSDYTTCIAATKPATVTAKASSPSKGKINLSWNSVSGSEGYQVWYKNGNGSYKLYKTVGAGVRSMSFSNLKSGRKYTFAVRAGIKTSGGNIFGGYKTATVTVK